MAQPSTSSGWSLSLAMSVSIMVSTCAAVIGGAAPLGEAMAARAEASNACGVPSQE